MTKLDDAIDAALKAEDLQEVLALLDRTRAEDPSAWLHAFLRILREHGNDADREKLLDSIRHLIPSTARH